MDQPGTSVDSSPVAGRCKTSLPGWALTARRWAWVPIPAALVLEAALWAADLHGTYNWPGLMTGLYFAFVTLSALLVAILVARNFLHRGEIALLCLGCGVVAWGPAGLLGSIVGQYDANLAATINNLCLWLSAVCNLGSAELARRAIHMQRARRTALAVAYLGSVLWVVLITVAAINRWSPAFFIQHQGGTALRQLVVGTAIAMFAATALRLDIAGRNSASAFLYWYRLALALIAVCLFGAWIQPEYGGPLNWAGRVVHLAAGAYVWIAGLSALRETWDIRLESALRESEQRYRDLFNGMSEGFAVHELTVDRTTGREQFRYLDVNAAFERITGVQRDTLLGQTLDEAMPGSGEFWTEKFREVLAREAPASIQHFAAFRGRYYEVFVYRAAPGQVACLFRDVSERKRFEESLQAAKEAAEAASRAKSEFLANVSHELRTPMTAILGFADLLVDGEDLSVEQLGYVQIVRENAHALLQLINDILDLSRIESDRMPMERTACCPWTIAEEAVNLLRVRAEEKGLALHVDHDPEVPPLMLSDPARVRQILVNLVGNAVKFTEQGQVRVRVSVALAPDGAGRRVQFEVSDTGIGIRPESMQTIFEPFVQADMSYSRRYGGSGLGLSISRRLAERLGGQISLVSELGKGSCFTFSLDPGPWEGLALADHPQRADAAPGLDRFRCRGRVLVVDDVEASRELVRTLLERTGLTVELAEDGRSGCVLATQSAVEGKPYDLILMDVQMPELDGLDATRQLRSQQWTGPIVALTAYAMEGDRQRCHQAGCDHYLSKPVDLAQLLAVLRRYLS
jgi:PAS domain S-box-containing protein